MIAAIQTELSAMQLDSVFDMVLNGGPLMIPIAFCSVIAVAYVVERSIRLRGGELGSKSYGERIVALLNNDGPDKALEACQSGAKPLGRVLGAALRRTDSPPLEMEQAAQDAGAREVKRLNANLRPLLIIGMLTPLLGLLGTVWGMIQAFSNIALQDGLGKPEMLASGISQALVTTAAGLAVAIPTQAAHFWLKGRVDRFVRRTEDIFLDLQSGIERLRAKRGGAQA